jgi:hypothetical protein
MWPNTTISSDVKQACTQFKVLKGSNRIAEFQKIAKTIFNEEQEWKNQGAKKNFSTTKLSGNDVEKMLGKADAELQNGEWVYYLNTSKDACKAIIGLDKTAQTIYCSITDCD